MKILKFEKLESTQKIAKKLAREGKKPWTIILAKEQEGGYGRKGDFWHSPKGGLYFSIILPKSKIENLQILNFLAAFCVAKILKENFKLEPFLKLPNDIFVNGKKICGILTENVIFGNLKYSVMGIGLNTNIDKFPKDLEKKATSIKIELKKEINNEEILKEIIKGLKEIFVILTQTR